MHDAAQDFQAAFIVAQLDPLRALPILRVPGAGREPDLSERQLHARGRVHQAMAVLGGISPAGSCVWHVIGLQRSVREWAIRQGWVVGLSGSSGRREFWSRRSGCWRCTSGTVRPEWPSEGCTCDFGRQLRDRIAEVEISEGDRRS
jgi:hypothetical protein